MNPVKNSFSSNKQISSRQDPGPVDSAFENIVARG